MILLWAIVSITLVISVWAAWSVYQNTKTLEVLSEALGELTNAMKVVTKKFDSNIQNVNIKK